ncbi:MAG: tetratricopeptide repeat protein [Candidatus Omnitrophica bacterium]|nr:tetratricopeptide repeat protein [Candidatus Omnitrophota bacterium]
MDAKQQIESNSRQKKVVFSVLLIVAFGLLAYGNSLNGKFIWDDDALIKNNVCLRDWSYITKIFSGNVEAGAGGKTSFYRPVQTLTYMLDYRFWKLDEKGYHLTNTIWHISAALLLLWMADILFQDRLIALLASLFFVAHPVHAEAVSYISGRAEPLSTFFILLALILYVKSLKTEKAGLYFGMVFCYAVALLSKENAIIFPAILMLYHFGFKGKIKPKQFMTVLGVTAAYLALRFTLLKELLSYNSYVPGLTVESTTLLERLPKFFVALTGYLRLLILPLNLHMEYGNTLFSYTDIKAILGIGILFGSLIFAFKKRENNTLVFFSIIWFFAALLPVSNLYPINAYMAEHWLYLPSIGFFLVLSQPLSVLFRNRKFKIFAAVLIVLWLMFLAALTRRQNHYWRDPVTFYEQTLRYAPDSYRLYSNLGNAYNVAGKTDEAIRAYQKSIEVNKTGFEYAQPYNGLGVAYYHSGKVETAVVMLKKAVEINPRYPEAYYNLGQMYKILNKSQESLEAFEKTVQINPLYADAHYELSTAHYQNRNYDLALQHYDLAVKLGHDMDAAFLKKLEYYRH